MLSYVEFRSDNNVIPPYSIKYEGNEGAALMLILECNTAIKNGFYVIVTTGNKTHLITQSIEL